MKESRRDFIYKRYLTEVIRQIEMGKSCHLARRFSIDILRSRFPQDDVRVGLQNEITRDPLYIKCVDEYMKKNYGYKFTRKGEARK